jgi:hypothetical protein
LRIALFAVGLATAAPAGAAEITGWLIFDDAARVLPEQEWSALRAAILETTPEPFAMYRDIQGKDYPIDDVAVALEDFDRDGRLDAFVALNQSMATCAGNSGWCDLQVFVRTDLGWVLAASGEVFDALDVYVRTEPDGRTRYFEMAPAGMDDRNRPAEREVVAPPARPN